MCGWGGEHLSESIWAILKITTMVGDDKKILLFTQSRMLRNAILGFIYGTSCLAERNLKYEAAGGVNFMRQMSPTMVGRRKKF